MRFNLTPVFLVVRLFCMKILFNVSFSHQLKSPQGPQEFLVEFDFPAKDYLNYYDQVKSIQLKLLPF